MHMPEKQFKRSIKKYIIKLIFDSNKNFMRSLKKEKKLCMYSIKLYINTHKAMANKIKLRSYVY